MHANVWIYVSGLVLGDCSLTSAGFGYQRKEIEDDKVGNKVTVVYDSVKSMNILDFAKARDITGFTTNWNL